MPSSRPASRPSTLLAAAAVLALAAGCGGETEPPAAETGRGSGEAAIAAADDPFSGMYRVKGHTVDTHSGDTRVIQGTVILAERSGTYVATSDLSTKFPSPGGQIDADVIGKGEGRRRGEILTGTAETQLVLQTVPGVSTDFAFIPRSVGPRIVSSWTAHMVDEDTIVVELHNEPGEGEDYAPTTTTLRGDRVIDAERR